MQVRQANGVYSSGTNGFDVRIAQRIEWIVLGLS